MFNREIIDLWCCKPPLYEKWVYSFEFHWESKKLMKVPEEFKDWLGYSYEEFTEAVIERFGYCWKMVFRTFRNGKWFRGYTKINWR